MSQLPSHLAALTAVENSGPTNPRSIILALSPGGDRGAGVASRTGWQPEPSVRMTKVRPGVSPACQVVPSDAAIPGALWRRPGPDAWFDALTTARPSSPDYLTHQLILMYENVYFGRLIMI